MFGQNLELFLVERGATYYGWVGGLMLCLSKMMLAKACECFIDA